MSRFCIFKLWAFLLIAKTVATNTEVCDSGLKRSATIKTFSLGRFKEHKGSYLNVPALITSLVKKKTACHLKCMKEKSCVSINFASSANPTGEFWCELLSDDKYNSSVKFGLNATANHYSIYSPCQSDPCLHGSRCLATYTDDTYTCACLQGYTGRHCETDINECQSNPCLNGATCTDHVNGYTCSCKLGYTGIVCQQDINECQSNPCLNGATCTDHVNGYTCSCKLGYTGIVCQQDINECQSNPCLNGATCTDHVNGYTCSCALGYTGIECQQDINECQSNPCLNGATCTDHVNGYTCSCKLGYTGIVCQKVLCPSGWKYFKDSCYWADERSMSWYDARAACVSLGGDLVKISNEEESQFVHTISASGGTWIGLKRENDGFRWVADNSLISYTSWAPGEPGAFEQCVWMGFTAPTKWDDTNCYSHLGFVCELLM
ncbi:fibropellin-1-like isoform X1 [Nematostella vectensis]|uniref:fibropellin-1-like isoform X1 n=1 Tax=Nematostella vectensis TaxID=45351 RepID=UPI002076E32F|nr:fibropellin-1-like isoform X1 [Nematostella vectensis]